MNIFCFVVLVVILLVLVLVMVQYGLFFFVQSQLLGLIGGVICQQLLDVGWVIGSVDILQLVGEVQVIVCLLEFSSVVGQYCICFSDFDVNGDGFISCEEVQVNLVLVDEFNLLDCRYRGKLDCIDLVGWLVD